MCLRSFFKLCILENFKYIQKRGEYNETSCTHHSASTILFLLHPYVFPLQVILKWSSDFVSSVSMYYNFYYSCISSAFFLGLNYLSVIKEKHNKNNSKFFNKYLLKEYYWMNKSLKFIEHVLCARLCTKCLVYTIHLIRITTWNHKYYFLNISGG